ncbi:MAG: hypothetical protein WDO68_26800 [Gammaproteobacteria bacterium]
MSANTEQFLPDHAGGSPDPLILASWLVALGRANVPLEPLEPQPLLARSDATPTYLQTRRLRL